MTRAGIQSLIKTGLSPIIGLTMLDYTVKALDRIGKPVKKKRKKVKREEYKGYLW